MQGVMVVPGRRGMGYIRGLGQPAGPFMPTSPPVAPDSPRVFTVEDLAGLGKGSLEQTLEVYKFFTRAAAIREKSAFMSEALLNIEKDPALRSFVLSSEEGRNYYGALDASKSLFLSLTQPNVSENLRIVAGMIEINVLKAKFSMGVKGRIPRYQNGASELSYSVIDTTAGMKDTFDLGDLTKTTMLDDIRVMDAAAKAVDPQAKILGELTTIAIIAIVLGSLAGLGIVYAIVSKVIDGKQLVIPPLPPTGVDPGSWAEFLKKFNQTEKSFGERIENIVTLLVVGLGIITVGGTIFYFVTKD